MQSFGKSTYLAAIALTVISLLLTQLTAGGKQSQPRQPTLQLVLTQNPITVDVSLDQAGSATETITTRGGEVTATGTDGTRFILTIPKGALAQTAEITMMPVARINNLPLSGGLVAAVQITPEDLVLLKTPTLVVRPRTPISTVEQMDFASFAYRGNGREFHLYPMETDPKRIAFQLIRFGSFGVGRGTEGEQEKIRARLPSDSSDRLMMQMQKLKSVLRKRLLAKPAARLSPDKSEWRIVRASFTATDPQDGQMPAQMRRDIINRLREMYQEILPKLKAVKLECKEDMAERLREAIEPAQGWLRAVQLLGFINRLTQDDLTSEEIETLITDRVNSEGLIGRDYQNRIRNFNRAGMVVTERELRRVEGDRLRREGYNDQEIEDILRETESIRAEFEKMSAELNRLSWELMKQAYDTAYKCCLKEAKLYYLNMMDSIGHELSINNRAEGVSMEKRGECLCAIESLRVGQSGAWSGEITHTENFVDERTETLGNRQNKYYKKHDYRAVINLVYHFRSVVAGPQGSHIPAQVSVTGSVDSSTAIENRWTSASMDKRQGSESKENYSGNLSGEDSNVTVNIRPDGTYNVQYAAPCADASGRTVTRSYTEGTGFPEFQKRDDTRSRLINRDVCPTQPGVLLRDGQHVGITGRLDSKDPKTISGTKTFEVPLDGKSTANKTITITWKLKRCK